jgi:hypothetical protein
MEIVEIFALDRRAMPWKQRFFSRRAEDAACRCLHAIDDDRVPAGPFQEWRRAGRSTGHRLFRRYERILRQDHDPDPAFGWPFLFVANLRLLHP